MANKEEIPRTSPAEIEKLIEQIRAANLDEGAKAKIERLLRTVLTLVELLQRKNKSIRKLKDMIFGGRTERQRSGKPGAPAKPDKPGKSDDPAPQSVHIPDDREHRFRASAFIFTGISNIFTYLLLLDYWGLWRIKKVRCNNGKSEND